MILMNENKKEYYCFIKKMYKEILGWNGVSDIRKSNELNTLNDIQEELCLVYMIITCQKQSLATTFKKENKHLDEENINKSMFVEFFNKMLNKSVAEGKPIYQITNDLSFAQGLVKNYIADVEMNKDRVKLDKRKNMMCVS